MFNPECPIYLNESGKPPPGQCSTYPFSCENRPCRHFFIGNFVYSNTKDIIYRIKSFNRYGSCNIPIFNLESSDKKETATSTACYLLKALDENDINFHTIKE